MKLRGRTLFSKARVLWPLTYLFAGIACMAVALAEESAPKKQLCATTPTYKYFEDLQYDAYTKNPIFLKMLHEMRDNAKMLKDLTALGDQLNKRHNILGTREDDPKSTVEDIMSSLKQLHLPTCYENPAVYFLLTQYAKQIDAARAALNLISTSEVNLATLPTTEVNAHTYPAFGGIGNVLAFNIQLFMFDYQMTKSIISTIDLRRNNGSIAIDHSPLTAIKKIMENSEISTDFSMALLEFIGLVAPSTRPIDQSYDSLLIKFTSGMELFAVAHEYGHVISQHQSATVTMPIGIDSNGDPDPDGRNVEVLRRSWQQELEADQIGIRLVLATLRSEAKKGAAQDLTWLYAAKGALFFFRCLEIVEEAKILKKNAHLSAPVTFAERVFLRAFADGRSSDADNEIYRYLTTSDYPPPWLRLERVAATINAELAAALPSRESEAFSEIADAIIENAAIVWRTVSSRFHVIVEVVRLQKTKGFRLSKADLDRLQTESDGTAQPKSAAEFPPGCYLTARSWRSTFLCDPTLQEAVVAYEAGLADDDTYMRLYRTAFTHDWLLLSGVQIGWAEKILREGNTSLRDDALAILALSGNRTSVAFLEALDLTAWSQADRRLLERTRVFLSQYGRDLTTARLAVTEPETFRATQFLSGPGNTTDSVENVIPRQASYDTEAFLARYAGVSAGVPVSSLMLDLLYKGWTPGKVSSELADLLEALGSKDAALKFANYGVAAGGPLQSLENTVGNILTSKQEFAQANIHYSVSLSAGRADGWPELNIANNLYRLGQDDQAEIMYRRALARRSNVRSEIEFAEYLNDTAWFLATRRSDDETKLKEALVLSSESNGIVHYRNPNYLDTLAECQFRLGDRSAAVRTAQAVLELVPPSDVETHRKFADRLAFFENVVQSSTHKPGNN